MEITYKITDWFIDRANVLEKVGKARQKALMTAGAYIRRAARDRLKRSKKSAPPGESPRRHSPDPNLATILFALDPSTDSMVIGPVKLNAKKPLRNSSAETLPQLLEHGGTAEITEYSLTGAEWMPLPAAVKAKEKRRQPERLLKRRTRQVQYSNPFMGPALQAALPDIPAKFRDLI